MKNPPKEIWIIFDPLDGPHIFISESSAIKTSKRWEKDAGPYDSFWDMVGPIKYVVNNGK